MKLKKQSVTADNPYKICFVCLGNICRSPTAEGVFQHLVNQINLQKYFYIDSAGTSAYHIGEPANSKSREVASKHGVELKSRARKFEESDLGTFDLIIAMDHENLSNVRELAERAGSGTDVMLLRDFDPEPGSREVPDPYYGGMDGFEKVYRVVERSCKALLDELQDWIER